MKKLLSRMLGRQKEEENSQGVEASATAVKEAAPSAASNATPITVVSGLPRSGTSLMMRMLEAGGIPVMVDNLRTADTDNPNGYYELERVKKLPAGDTEWLMEARGKVVKIISFLLNTLPAEHQYRIVFMDRALPEVLASQQKMLVHRDEATDELSDEKATELFTAHLAQTKGWLSEQSNIEVFFMDYGKLVHSPAAHVARLDDFFNGMLDVAAMMEVIDPDLYRNRG